MFTGIVTDVGEVAAAEGSQGTLKRLRIHSAYDPATIALGASIACGGPCLTVVAVGLREGGCWFDVDAAAETLERTTVGDWQPGTRINLERSLKIGDELGGHIVTGHVEKGSVCLDGTSLTVNSVNDDLFSVLIIPHTLAVTTWGDRQVGDRLNLEVDLMARYAARLADARRAE
jgi:riboflavin synthase